jgi:hypothetical protein
MKKILEQEWDSQGMCRSCGFHALLSEYSDDIIYFNKEKNRYELPCLNKQELTKNVRFNEIKRFCFSKIKW